MIIKLLEGFLNHLFKIIVVHLNLENEGSITPQLEYVSNELIHHTQSLLLGTEGTISITPQLEYVPSELIHHIQSLLPPKDAARTCILSKSWLHAWSTIPTLRFTNCVPYDHLTTEEDIKYVKLIDRTLSRYLSKNISIECFHIHLHIQKWSLPFYAEKWFQSLASKSYLKELCVTICGKKLAGNWNTHELHWLTVPDVVFSSENLEIISLRVDNMELYHIRMNINHVIKCLFLRVLELKNVYINEGALHNLFSSCSLLEKINIEASQDLKRLEVKNLRRLRELKIMLVGHINDDNLDIYGVPSLRVFYYHELGRYTLKMAPLGSVRELVLFRVMIDNTFSDMIRWKFPFLESLTLKLINCRLETLEITSVSLKRLLLKLYDGKQFTLQVCAPKLLYFCYEGLKMPRLLFPTNTPEHIKLIFMIDKYNPFDKSFFLKMREALDLASNFDIAIETKGLVPLEIDLEDLRRRVPFPARNVQQLSFKIYLHEHLLKLSPLFDLFFSVCYPRQVNAYYKNGNNYLHELMVIGMMETNTPDLKDIQIKNPRNGKWENMTDSWRRFHFQFELPWRSFHDEANAYSSDEFKLNW